MSIRLGVLTGGRAGTLVRFRTGPVVIGRAADADLRLHAEADLTVSARHAVLESEGDAWFLRDGGSTNGTLLNGRWVQGRVPLAEGDRIGLGASGPILRFHREGAGTVPEIASPSTSETTPVAPGHAAAGGAAETVSPAAGSGARAAGGAPAPPPASSSRSPVVPVLAGVLAAAALVVAIVVPLQRERAEVRALNERLDSIQEASSRTISGLREQVSGLENALETSRAELRDLGEDLQAARAAGDESQAEVLERRLEEATAELDRKERAAGLDFSRVAGLNRPALAEIYLNFGPGEVLTATAFAVRADGLLVTNRHVVERGGGAPSEIAVQFSGSTRVWPGVVVARSDDADLAALRILGDGVEVPVIEGFHRRPDTLSAGLPVAIMGFPLGGVGRDGARPEVAVGAGTVRAVLATQLQVDGYGAPGSSGSPVLDAEGRLVGVVRGGRERADGTTLVAVPSSVALRFVEDVLARERTAPR